MNNPSRRGDRAGGTGGVITSAGCVLAGTFGILCTAPLTTLVELGFAIAFGVLLDTFIIKSVLITALNLDLGRWMWWPSGLARQRLANPAQAASQSAAGR